jgi:hypothetical protein
MEVGPVVELAAVAVAALRKQARSSALLLAAAPVAAVDSQRQVGMEVLLEIWELELQQAESKQQHLAAAEAAVIALTEAEEMDQTLSIAAQAELAEMPQVMARAAVEVVLVLELELLLAMAAMALAATS